MPPSLVFWLHPGPRVNSAVPFLLPSWMLHLTCAVLAHHHHHHHQKQQVEGAYNAHTRTHRERRRVNQSITLRREKEATNNCNSMLFCVCYRRGQKIAFLFFLTNSFRAMLVRYALFFAFAFIFLKQIVISLAYFSCFQRTFEESDLISGLRTFTCSFLKAYVLFRF